MPHSAKSLFSTPDEVIHVRDIGLDTAGDDEIIEYALKDGHIVITRDLDFANTEVHPIHTHAGAVVLRVPSSFTAENIKKVLKQFLSVVDVSSLPHTLTIVEPGQFRVRRDK